VKPALQLRLGQQLKLTPQLQNAIRLLSLSSIELEKELISAVESNPLLTRSDSLESQAAEAAEAADAPNDSTSDEPSPEIIEQETWSISAMDMPSSGRTNSTQYDLSDTNREFADTDQDDLKSSLLWQLNLSNLSQQDSMIACALIDAVSDDGLMIESLDTIQESLRPDLDAEMDDIEAILHHVQQFEPAGVCARSIQESLSLQLSSKPPYTPGLWVAKQIVEKHLELLAEQKIPQLKRALEVDQSQLELAVELLRSLDARPGSANHNQRTEYVAPEVIVRKVNDQWQVTLARNPTASLSINEVYVQMISKASKEDTAYLKEQLQEARWLIKSLETRDQTLMTVARAIVTRQTGFFEQGPSALRPMIMKDIAELTELHESTISRISNRKYMLTPHGVLQLKYFFSSSLSTTDGDGSSSTAVQERIRQLISEEPPRKPLSDNKLGLLLKAEGIQVARRTVTKYREALKIPSSPQRKRLI